MSGSQYPSDVQFAGLIQAATAAADAQERNASALGKRKRSGDEDDSMIDTQLRTQPGEYSQDGDGSVLPNTPFLQSSASVLFRAPSEKSKKYSRPPLGKVYADLELAPESFLRLQHAAKDFMLDADHIDRRNVVGHKKNSSNNDVAKLKLWSCVEEFLESWDNGERYFGHSAGANIPGAPTRTFFWPEDKHRIVKLCMPLFRKIVTNERQRVYASETRSKTDKSTKADQQPDDGSDTPDAHPEIDSRLKVNTIESPLHPSHHEPYAVRPTPEEPNTGTIIVHVNIVSNASGTLRRVKPRMTIASEDVTSLTSIMSEVERQHDLSQRNSVEDGEGNKHDWKPVVKVWLQDGLVTVKDDGEWMVAVLNAGTVDWMDGELRVLIEV